MLYMHGLRNKDDEVFFFKYYRIIGLDTVVRATRYSLQVVLTTSELSYARTEKTTPLKTSHYTNPDSTHPRNYLNSLVTELIF